MNTVEKIAKKISTPEAIKKPTNDLSIFVSLRGIKGYQAIVKLFDGEVLETFDVSTISIYPPRTCASLSRGRKHRQKSHLGRFRIAIGSDPSMMVPMRPMHMPVGNFFL